MQAIALFLKNATKNFNKIVTKTVKINHVKKITTEYT